ncbi:MAG: hypothetical protein O7G30_05040 [Proteobacteria bacterium]|nr:hypothetical protein [Pseudomonadota bacterium]
MNGDGTVEIAAQSQVHEGQDWRVWFGVSSTIFWLGLGYLYIDTNVGWSAFATQPADALGSFLEGAFAPLAFLWLVIGFFLQQRELRHNNQAILLQYEQMRRTAENAEIQARAISANELHQRQETFLMVADRVHRQLGAVVGLLWMSSQAAGADEGGATEDQVADLWSRLGSGDPEAFARQFMGLYFRTRQQGLDVTWDLFFGTEIRTRHSETILQTFERLMNSGKGCDPDGIITDALLGSGHGSLYQIIRELKDNPPESRRG